MRHNAELGSETLARLRDRVGDTDELAIREARVFLGVEAAEVAGADDGAAQSRHVVDSIAVRSCGLPPQGRRLRLTTMAWNDLFIRWYQGLSPGWRRELRIAALWFGFGLLVMPFLIYLAGVLTLGPYEGGLLSFLGSLLVAFFTATPTAWLLVAGPYLLFTAVRFLTRPLRRQG
jgi:hypothetical protein